MDSLAIQARKASQDPSDCRRAIDSLRSIGFGEDAFRGLHHQRGSMAEFYSYTESIRQFVEDGNNHRVHQRLIFVLLSCLDGVPPKGKNFQALADEAYRLIPPVDLRVLTK
jgi:hypothetical protein